MDTFQICVDIEPFYREYVSDTSALAFLMRTLYLGGKHEGPHYLEDGVSHGRVLVRSHHGDQVPKPQHWHHYDKGLQENKLLLHYDSMFFSLQIIFVKRNLI